MDYSDQCLLFIFTTMKNDRCKLLAWKDFNVDIVKVDIARDQIFSYCHVGLPIIRE